MVYDPFIISQAVYQIWNLPYTHKTYTVQEHLEFKHLVPCFSGNSNGGDSGDSQIDKLSWRIIRRDVNCREFGRGLFESNECVFCFANIDEHRLL